MDSISWTVITERNGTFTYYTPAKDEYKVRQLLAPGGWVLVWRAGEEVNLRTDYIVAVIKNDQNIVF